MPDTQDAATPFGTWPSPITAELVASAGIEFGHVALDGDTAFRILLHVSVVYFDAATDRG